MPSIVFDYGQGFTVESSSDPFTEYASPIEVKASLEGVAINPLQLFPADIHGPVNVAQRVADTFQRVYPQIGVQQHAVLRQAILDVMIDEGITPDSPESWHHPLPAFAALQRKLHAYAENPGHPQRRMASSVASHISTMFVFNTFQDNGTPLDWQSMLDSEGRVCVIQLSEDNDANTICTVSDFAAYVFLHGAKGAGTAARLRGTITRPEQTRQRKQQRAYDGGNAKAALSQPTARLQQGLTRCSMRVKPHLNFPPPYPHIWLQHHHCRALLTVTKRKQQNFLLAC